MIVIEAVRQLLVDLGVGVAGQTLFLADQNLPTGTTTVYYSLTQTPGRYGIKTHGSGSISEPWFQLLVRHGKLIEAYRAAEDAWKKFDNKDAPIANRTVGDKFFLWVRPLTPPFTLAADAEQRSRVAFTLGTSVRDVPIP